MLLWSSLKPYTVVKALHALAERRHREEREAPAGSQGKAGQTTAPADGAPDRGKAGGR